MSKICDKSVFVIFRPINTHYCHSRGCTLQHNLHSVFSQRPCSPDTYFAMQCYSRVHYFALYFSCIFNLKRIGSQVNEDDDFHNLITWTTGTEHPPGVPPVRHQDVVLAVHRHARRSVELTVALACTNYVLYSDEI